MKKLIALLLVVVMVLTMAGCSMKQNKFLKQFEKKTDKLVEAVEDEDYEKAEEIAEDIEKLLEDNEDWLEEIDEEKDEKFIEKMEEISEDYMKAVMGLALGGIG